MLASASADPITPQKAMQIAQEYFVPGKTMTMSVRAKARKATTQNSPYYIISRGTDCGYVIVAGDDCLPEVLGYTDSGNFDANDLPPALQDMLEAWQMAVENAQADGSNITEARVRKARRKANNRVNILPFVTSHWHQSSPYNDNCPTITSNGNRAATGCVATAASQILYYWRKDLPSTLQASTPTYGYGDAPVTRSVPKGTPLKWDLMLDQYGSESREYKQAVAEFVFATGAATWLTYGASTAGNIEKIPYTFSTYFGMNGGTVHYRDSYSQEAWTQLVYNELAQGHPVMYTGVHPTNGGHAVFVHGYQASTDKMYFNFGWGAGNGYDGYYTTDQTTGMNGFCGSQSCLIGAYPKKWNMDVQIFPSSHTYANIENKYTVKIRNNSTLDMKGVYLFASTSTVKPTDLSKASSSDAEAVFERGTTNSVQLTVKPSSAKKTYITVTDSKLNVIGSMEVEAENPDATLVFENIAINGSTETTEKDGISFTNVYNDGKVLIDLTVSNRGNSAWGGTSKSDIYCLNEETNDWEYVKYASNTKTEVGKDGSFLVELSTTGLEVGKYYYATCSEEWGIGTMKENVDTSNPKVAKVYFTLKGADLEVVGYENNVLALKGHFDNATFNTSMFAKKSTYKTAVAYDLTECVGVEKVTQEVNPNALYYVSDDSKAEGTNIVKAGVCADLVLTAGYNFVPRADFTAKLATLNLGIDVARWRMITVPFDAVVPDGLIVREDTLYKNGIKTKEVRNLEAGKTYLVMASSTRSLVLRGENAKVASAPTTNADPSIVGTYTNITAPKNAMIPNDDEKQYFFPVEETAYGTEIKALSGYFYNSTVNAMFRAYSSLTLDPAYETLAEKIEEAYTILDKYADIVSASARTAYLDKIHEAEAAFTERPYETSTLVKKCYEQLLADGEVYMKQIEDLGNTEIDFTGNIVNPSFEAKIANGWTVGKKSGVTNVGSVIDGTKANDNRAVGLDGTYVFQSFIAADSTSVSLEQEVKGLTPGYYRLTAMVGTDRASEVTLFAGDSTAVVKGHEFGNLYLSKATIDNVLVEASEGAETGTLNIGVKAGRWYKVDDFTLTFVRSIKKEEPDAIISVADGRPIGKDGIYTIMGTKVEDTSRPGIYIMNGSKFIK